MSIKKILLILFFVSVFCSHAQAAKRQPEDQSNREKDSKKSRRDELPAVVDDGPESSDDETGPEEWETTSEEIVGSCDAEVVESNYVLPLEVLCDDIMPSLELRDALNLCSTDYRLRMTCLPLVLHRRISNETLNPTQLCNCLKVFSSYLGCAHFVDKASAFYAIQAAQQNITHEYFLVREAALDLFRALFQHNRGFAEVFQVAQQYITHENFLIRITALDLFRALFQHNRGFAEAIAVAKQNINHVNLWIRKGAFDLFMALFQHNRGFAEAIAVAKQNINHVNLWIRKGAFDLFMALFEHGRGFVEAIAVAKQNINHVNLWIRKGAFDLFMALFEHGRGFVEAIQAAEQNISNETCCWLKVAALNLFSALVKNIQYCPAKELKAQIMAQASRAITQNYSSDWVVLRAVQRLKEALNRYAQ